MEYQGDPYMGCRPECVLNNDCAQNKACINRKCKDPCPGICGQNALCNVYNHIPMCQCPEKMTGNAFIECKPVESNITKSILNLNKIINNLYTLF